MKRIYTVLFFAFVLSAPSCHTVKQLFSADDATGAIKELLSFGTQYGGDLLSKKNGLSKENILQSILPGDAGKILSTLETLGLSKEVSRFSSTLTSVAEKSAEKSVPIFLQGIKNMGFKDAVGIVKKGGTSATDYLRSSIGDTLRSAITPAINSGLEEYKLVSQWNNLVAPAKMFLGDKLNLDLGNLLSGVVANMMFNKIAEKEMAIRTKAAERKTALLQKVFGQVLNKVSNNNGVINSPN
jgi:Protein of unknown function (DUF4197)